MTKQEAFDIVVKHLLTQNKKSISDQGSCLYRGPNNTKCALGALIPDDLYDPCLENLTPHHFFKLSESTELPKSDDAVKIGEYLKLTDSADSDAIFYDTLQRIHDDHPVDEWKSLLEKFAELYSLQFNPPS